jgi:AcrR family transcriptional regulator
MKEVNTAAKIASVTLRILEKDGPEAVSMRRVASVVGITPMAIYRHFPSREDLLHCATESEFQRLAKLMEGVKGKGRAEAGLFKVMDRYLDYGFARPRLFDYVFCQPRKNARRFPDDFRARQSPTLNLVADILAEGMDRKEFRKDDEWEVALEVWAHIHGYLVLFRAGRFTLPEKQFRQLCHRSLRRLLNGLKP